MAFHSQGADKSRRRAASASRWSRLSVPLLALLLSLTHSLPCDASSLTQVGGACQSTFIWSSHSTMSGGGGLLDFGGTMTPLLLCCSVWSSRILARTSLSVKTSTSKSLGFSA